MMYKKNLRPTIQFIHELTQEEVTISRLPFTEKEGRFVFEKSDPPFLLHPEDVRSYEHPHDIDLRPHHEQEDRT